MGAATSWSSHNDRDTTRDSATHCRIAVSGVDAVGAHLLQQGPAADSELLRLVSFVSVERLVRSLDELSLHRFDGVAQGAVLVPLRRPRRRAGDIF